MWDLPNKSRKRLSNISDELEDGEIIDNQCTKVGIDPFCDGFDDQLLGVAVDRARMQGYNEFTPEKKYIQPRHRRDDLRRELVIKSKLVREIEVKERSKVRRLNLGEQGDSKKRENAFGRLMDIRHSKMITEKVPENTSMEEIYQPPAESKFKLKTADIYSDNSSHSGSEAEMPHRVKLVSTYEELSRGVLTRNQLESLLDKPIFEQTVKNCFVNVNVNQVYRISQITGLEHSKRKYYLGSKRTSLILRLNHAGQYVYSQMDVVSNQPVTPLEFNDWLSTCQREGYPLPPLTIIEKKAKDIEEASNYSFTEGDVEKIVRVKQKEGKKTVSAAYQKVCLIMERDMAVDSNDLETANRLDRKIRAMDRDPEPDREHAIEAGRIAQMSCALPTRKCLAERLPKANDFDLERYMRRKYKKSALISRARVNAQEFEDDPSMLVPSEVMVKDCTSKKDDEKRQKLDLYKLHNFDVVLDISSLPPLNAILTDIKI